MESSSDLNRQLLGTLGSGYYHRPCIQRFACISAIAIAVGVVLLFLVLCALYCICCPAYFRCWTIPVLHLNSLEARWHSYDHLLRALRCLASKLGSSGIMSEHMAYLQKQKYRSQTDGSSAETCTEATARHKRLPLGRCQHRTCLRPSSSIDMAGWSSRRNGTCCIRHQARSRRRMWQQLAIRTAA